MSATTDCTHRIQSHVAASGELSNRIVAVTGAGSGIGRAVAMAAAAQGAEVILISKDIKRLEAVHTSIAEASPTARAIIAPLDLERAIAADYDQLVAAIAGRYGRLDGLVHCAALLGTPAPVEHYDVPAWCRVLHVNLTAAFVLTQVLLPLLRASTDASVAFTSCRAGREPGAFGGAYAVSKAAIEAFSQVLADEYRGTARVRVNTVDPGPARTALRRAAFPSEDQSTIPEPARLTRTYMWLLSAASRGVTAQALTEPALQPD